MNCDNCYHKTGGCQAWMTAKRPCSRFVSWDEVRAVSEGKVSLKAI